MALPLNLTEKLNNRTLDGSFVYQVSKPHRRGIILSHRRGTNVVCRVHWLGGRVENLYLLDLADFETLLAVRRQELQNLEQVMTRLQHLKTEPEETS